MMNLYEAGAYAAAGDMVVKLQVSENLSPHWPTQCIELHVHFF